MRSFTLRILTAEGPVYDGPAESLVVRALDGELGILAGHARLLNAVVPCVARVRIDDRDAWFVVGDSALEVDPEAVLLLAEFAVRADTLTNAHLRLAELQDWQREAVAGAAMT